MNKQTKTKKIKIKPIKLGGSPPNLRSVLLHAYSSPFPKPWILGWFLRFFSISLIPSFRISDILQVDI